MAPLVARYNPPRPTESWKPLGAVVRISGVGSGDRPDKQIGNAQNYAELHPVIVDTAVGRVSIVFRSGGELG